MAKVLGRLQHLPDELKGIDARYATSGPLGEPRHRSKLRDLRPEEIRELREQLGLTQEQLANWLGVSWVSISRWERNQGRPAVRESRTLARLIELLHVVGKRLTPEEMARFFGEPHEDLFHDRPVDVLATELGYRAVRDILEGLLTGAYS